MPVRTGLEFLASAFRSIAMQKTTVEVALLDASGDKTVAAMAEQSGLQFHYRYHRSNDDGQAAAIQIGWDNGSAKYLGWLNADDQLLPGALETVAAAFSEHPDVDVVYGQACYLDETGAFLGYFPAFSPNQDQLTWSNTICQPAAFLRRSSMQRVGGLNTDLHYTMDWDLWLRLHKSGCRFLAIDTVLAAVVNHAGSKTNSGHRIRNNEISAILKRHKRRMIDLREYFSRLYGEAALSGHALPWRLLKHGAAFRRRLLRRSATPLPSYCRGIGPLNNEVRQSCQILMPAPEGHKKFCLHLYSDKLGDFSTAPSAGKHIAGLHAKDSRPMAPTDRRHRSGFGGRHYAYHYTGEFFSTLSGVIDVTFFGPETWGLIAVEAEPIDQI